MGAPESVLSGMRVAPWRQGALAGPDDGRYLPALFLFGLLAVGLSGCAVDVAASPDVVCSKEQLADILRGLADSFSSGFGEPEARRAADAATSLPRGEFRVFEHKDVVFRERTYREFSFDVQRLRDGKIGLLIRTPDDAEFQRLLRTEIRRLAFATYRGE